MRTPSCMQLGHGHTHGCYFLPLLPHTRPPGLPHPLQGMIKREQLEELSMPIIQRFKELLQQVRRAAPGRASAAAGVSLRCACATPVVLLSLVWVWGAVALRCLCGCGGQRLQTPWTQQSLKCLSIWVVRMVVQRLILVLEALLPPRSTFMTIHIQVGCSSINLAFACTTLGRLGHILMHMRRTAHGPAFFLC